MSCELSVGLSNGIAGLCSSWGRRLMIKSGFYLAYELMPHCEYRQIYSKTLLFLLFIKMMRTKKGIVKGRAEILGPSSCTLR